MIARQKYSPDQPRDERGRFGSGGSVPPADFTRDIPPAQAGYVYHATNLYNAQDIAETGKLVTHGPSFGTDQNAWPDGSREHRSYFTNDPHTAQYFAPSDGQPVLLRIPESNSVHTESTGDRYATKPIPASVIDYYGEDHGWHPLTDLASQGKSWDPRRKEGRRNSRADLAHIQAAHDATVAAGATCPEMDPEDDAGKRLEHETAKQRLLIRPSYKRVKSIVATDPVNEGRISFYAAVWDNIDLQGERTDRHSMDRDLAERRASGKRLPVCWSHTVGDVFGTVGFADPLTGGIVTDEHGLLINAVLDLANPTAARVMALAKMGVLDQASYGFSVRKQRIEKDASVRLLDVELHEVSLVLFGANPLTSVTALKHHRTPEVRAVVDELIREYGRATVTGARAELAELEQFVRKEAARDALQAMEIAALENVLR